MAPIALAGGCSNITVQQCDSRREFRVNLANSSTSVTPNSDNSISATDYQCGSGGGSGIRIPGDAWEILSEPTSLRAVSVDSTPGYGNGITLEDTAHDNESN